MAGAMLSRWLDTGTLAPGQVTVIDPALPLLPPGVHVRPDIPVTDGPPPAFLMLGVKPQLFDAIADNVSDECGASTVLLSILAGTPLETLRRRIPRAAAVVRVMPNLPVAIGQGAVALHAPDAPRTALDALMAPLGLVEWIDEEALFDAVTALSGSGPAFLYRFAEALAKGGAAMGLPPQQADRLARATVAGAAALAHAAPDPLGALADRVASKGGSTREGLNVLDKDSALNVLVEAALKAALARNRELARGA